MSDAILNLTKQGAARNDFAHIQLGIMSPESILANSYGEVTLPETPPVVLNVC